MGKDDGRKLSKKGLLAKRKQVIRLYSENTPVMQIVKECGLSWPAVNAAIKLYKAGGMSELAPLQRGRKQGTGRILSEDQENALQNSLHRKRPWQVGLKHPTRSIKLSLWNRDAVRQLVHKQCGIELSVRGVAKYLQRWGFPPMKQNQNPIERCSQEIQCWLNENYESLCQQSPAEIFWLSRKPLLIDSQEKKWSQKLSMLSAIDNHGKEHWLVFKGRFTQDRQIAFLKALTTQSLGKCISIRNNDDYFTDRAISNWLEEHLQETVVLPPTHLQSIRNDILSYGANKSR